MMNIDRDQRKKEYTAELVERVIPFWLQHAPDTAHGGHFSCITSKGKVFDTDKFMWMQGRFVWMCSYFAQQDALLGDELRRRCVMEAERGAKFLLQYGRDTAGDWFFAVDKAGNPLTAAYNIFSDVFSLMGLASCAAVCNTLSEQALDAAEATWNRLLQRQKNPKGSYNKELPARKYHAMVWPMIMLNLTKVIESSPLGARISLPMLRSMRQEAMEAIITHHMDTQHKVLREHVRIDTGFENETMRGRLFCPGHSCETAAFMFETLLHDGEPLVQYLTGVPVIQEKMRLAEADDIYALIGKIIEWNVTKGWDTIHDGMFYFMDVLDFPPEQLEHSMKLWWVHLEAAYAALLASTMNIPSLSQSAGKWYETIHRYMWKHFRSADQQEWFGYLSQDGIPVNNLLGGKWKGFFHLPRALLNMIKLLHSDK